MTTENENEKVTDMKISKMRTNIKRCLLKRHMVHGSLASALQGVQEGVKLRINYAAASERDQILREITSRNLRWMENGCEGWIEVER